MVQPRKKRRIEFDPHVTYFKPQGTPLFNLEEVNLEHEELEAIRLKYIEKLDQHTCAKKMKISQSTFHRTLCLANYKIAEALTTGRAIRIHTK